MSADPMYAITEAVADAAVYVALWAQRDANKPQLPVDLAGQNAVDAIDRALSELHGVRSALVSQVRQHQDACNARVDAMVAERRAAPHSHNYEGTAWERHDDPEREV